MWRLQQPADCRRRIPRMRRMWGHKPWFVVSVREDDLRNRVQETHPSPKTQRIAAEVCNHDPWSMITYFDKADLKTSPACLEPLTQMFQLLVIWAMPERKHSFLHEVLQWSLGLLDLSYLQLVLLRFLQLPGFCGSFLWWVGQERGPDCSEHGKHLGQAGREGAMLLLSWDCVNHPGLILSSASVWLLVATCYINGPNELSSWQLEVLVA